MSYATILIISSHSAKQRSSNQSTNGGVAFNALTKVEGAKHRKAQYTT